MLDLTNVEGRVRLRLVVTGEETPNDPYHWLIVRVNVSQDDQSFTADSSALHAEELPGLRDWFTCLTEDRLPRWATLDFTEEELAFKFLAKEPAGVRIGVVLSGGLRPNFRLKQLGLERLGIDYEWQVVCVLDNDQLKECVAGVQATIRRFPG
jgi:hypothetical protein